MKKLSLLCAFVLVACGGGKGSVAFTTWGEEFIEEGIPVDSNEVTGFVDGWSVKYSKFLITLGEVTVAAHDGRSAGQMTGSKVFDLTLKGPVPVVEFNNISAERWDHVSYAIAPSSESTTGNAAAADVAMMHSKGYSVYVEATATQGSASKTIKWGFATSTDYQHCEQAESGDGVVVPTGGTDRVQLTIHGDHLYYDDLESADAKIRFQAMADADGNSDGEVTLEELATVNLTSLPLGTYGTGGAGNIKTLRDFVTALTHTLGHFRGEGECKQKVR